jgi:CBS domain containing-hemolysin-like protein
MLQFILTILFAVITLSGIAAKKAYTEVPERELKRRAQKGDVNAKVLYRAVAYGLSLKVFLWLWIGIGTVGLFFVVVRDFPWPIALLGIVILLIVGFGLSNTRVTALGRRVTIWLTPAVVWKLNYLHPLLQAIGARIHKHAASSSHTRLYQKEDLVELLRQQAKQTDSRIGKEQIDMAIHSLTFGDKLVRETLTPYSQVKTVNIADNLGPLLMDELHKSGHSRFPVYEGKKNNIVGMLYLRDLLQEQHGGNVKNIYHKKVTYVHEEQTLYQTLQAFLKTKRHLFIVVNQFEEVVGIITIEDILEQIIGKPIMDEFDQYEDLRAVAARMAAKVHKEQKHETPEPVAKVPAETPKKPE